jgi:Tfp pilus assembly protein PilX
MRSRLRQESGFALIVTLMLLLGSLAIGIALVARADSQSNLSAHERTREGGFALAEAAMNAETVQLSRSWPTTVSAPTQCDPTSTDTACPLNSAVMNGYGGKDYASSCATSPNTPLWKTTVRDDAIVSGTAERFWTTAVNGRSAYDANGNGTVWLRSTASVQCDRVSMVTLVSRSTVSMAFPTGVVTANWFTTSNQGRKVIIDTLGTYGNPPRPASQPGPIVLRCQGVSGTCANYQAGKGQVQPPAIETNSTTSSTTLTLAQIQALERQATAAGTLYACPSAGANLSSVNGAPVVIQGPCNVSIGSNTIVNSSANPGVLVIENGTLTLSGTSVFYGLIYAVNRQNSSGSVVTISGNATVQGSISIDGLGGLTAGSSKTNVIYDSRAPTLLRGESGAVPNKNTFRVLPPSTP